MIEIADEKPGQEAAIGALYDVAFGGTFEARLVQRLRQDNLVVASLVAVDADQVVGHILFSDLAVDVDGKPVSAVSLAPVAVLSQRQCTGIGSLLVRTGLECVRERNRTAVIVVGHPGYYPRFGFSAALARKLASPYAGDAFMALELVAEALAGSRGTVRYPAAFDGS